jgi:superfamily II DNA or RNA helicase
LETIAKRLERFARHVIVLRGGQSEKQRRDITARLAAIPQGEERVIVATGRYLGEGFDDSRLDTLFLTMPIAWKGTLAQYAGRLHRLNDAKREVIIYESAGSGPHGCETPHWLSVNWLQDIGCARFVFRPGGHIERTRYAIVKRPNR